MEKPLRDAHGRVKHAAGWSQHLQPRATTAAKLPTIDTLDLAQEPFDFRPARRTPGRRFTEVVRPQSLRRPQSSSTTGKRKSGLRRPEEDYERFHAPYPDPKPLHKRPAMGNASSKSTPDLEKALPAWHPSQKLTGSADILGGYAHEADTVDFEPWMMVRSMAERISREGTPAVVRTQTAPQTTKTGHTTFAGRPSLGKRPRGWSLRRGLSKDMRVSHSTPDIASLQNTSAPGQSLNSPLRPWLSLNTHFDNASEADLRGSCDSLTPSIVSTKSAGRTGKRKIPLPSPFAKQQDVEDEVRELQYIVEAKREQASRSNSANSPQLGSSGNIPRPGSSHNTSPGVQQFRPAVAPGMLMREGSEGLLDDIGSAFSRRMSSATLASQYREDHPPPTNLRKDGASPLSMPQNPPAAVSKNVVKRMRRTEKPLPAPGGDYDGAHFGTFFFPQQLQSANDSVTDLELSRPSTASHQKCNGGMSTPRPPTASQSTRGVAVAATAMTASDRPESPTDPRRPAASLKHLPPCPSPPPPPPEHTKPVSVVAEKAPRIPTMSPVCSPADYGGDEGENKRDCNDKNPLSTPSTGALSGQDSSRAPAYTIASRPTNGSTKVPVAGASQYLPASNRSSSETVTATLSSASVESLTSPERLFPATPTANTTPAHSREASAASHKHGHHRSRSRSAPAPDFHMRVPLIPAELRGSVTSNVNARKHEITRHPTDTSAATPIVTTGSNAQHAKPTLDRSYTTPNTIEHSQLGHPLRQNPPWPDQPRRPFAELSRDGGRLPQSSNRRAPQPMLLASGKRDQAPTLKVQTSASLPSSPMPVMPSCYYAQRHHGQHLHMQPQPETGFSPVGVAL